MAEDLLAHQFLSDPKSREEVVDEEIDDDLIERLKEDPNAWEDVLSFRPGGGTE